MDRVIDHLGLGRELREWKTLQLWPSVAGKKIAAKVRAVRVQDGVLWLQTATPHWAAEVSIRKQELMDKLNGNDEIIKDLRFVGAWEGRKSRQ